MIFFWTLPFWLGTVLEVYSSVLSIVQYVNYILNTRYLSHGPIDVLKNINDINNKDKEIKTILIINY